MSNGTISLVIAIIMTVLSILVIGLGGYVTQEIPSINKEATVEVEGPLGMNSFMNGIAGVKFPSEVVVASTWNVDLAKAMGECAGEECRVQGFDGIMAPAMNIYRTPFSGRNFEYSSFNRLGSTWAGASYPLLTTVLREEWGFQPLALSHGRCGCSSTCDCGAFLCGNE